jgi:hypothetical protein
MHHARMNQLPSDRPGARLAAAGVAAAFLLAAMPLILTQFERGRGRFDQINYHEPAILRFAEQLPRPDVSDYLSATTPGYHLVLAMIARLVSPSPVVLQSAGALFTGGLLALYTLWVARRAGALIGAVLGASVGVSIYVFSSGVFLLPDNAAWLGVLGVILIALRPRFDAATLIGGGAVLLGLVLTRQSHLWAAGVLWAAAWLGAEFRGRGGAFGEIAGLFEGFGARARRTVLVGLATVPAFLAVVWFVRLWGGLTVPIYHDYMQGTNAATPAIILAQIGVIAVFHAGFWWRSGWRLVRTKPVLLLGVLAAGLLLAVIPETTYSVEAGRYSGLWNISARAPDLFGRSNSLILILAPAGAGALAAWLNGVGARERWVLLGTLAGFTVAVSLTLNAWQRYHEPMLLMLAGVMSALVVRGEREEFGREEPARRAGVPGVGVLGVARVVGPCVLALVLAGVTAQKFRSEAPVTTPIERQESVHRPLKELWPSRWERVEGPGR